MKLKHKKNSKVVTSKTVADFSKTLSQEVKVTEWDLCGYTEIDPDALIDLTNLANRSDDLGVAVKIVIDGQLLKVQLDFERFHRRFDINDLCKVKSKQEKPFEDEICAYGEGLLGEWRKTPEEICDFLIKEDIASAISLIKWIVCHEDQLYARNMIAPFEDLIPKVLEMIPTKRMAEILNGISPGIVTRILVSDYTRVDNSILAQILESMNVEVAAKTLTRMCRGVDYPVRIIPILAYMTKSEMKVLCERIDASILIKALDVSERPDEVENVLRCLGTKALKDVLSKLLSTKLSLNWSNANFILNLQESSVQKDVVALLSKNKINRLEQGKLNIPKSYLRSNFVELDELSKIVTGEGRRDVKELSFGRTISIDEEIDSIHGRKKVHVHMLEVDPSDYTFKCYTSSNSGHGFESYDKLLRPYYEQGKSPEESVFRELGMFRLAEAAREESALAGINGNFYFDYGHYAFALRAEIDLKMSPKLNYGDPIGLFYKGGKCFSPAIFNRATFVVCEDFSVHIERIRINRIVVNKKNIQWDHYNELCKDEEIGYFSPIWGSTTPKLHNHTDVCIAGTSIVGIKTGGETLIPFTGFVISIPTDSELLLSLKPGMSVEIFNDFNKGVIHEGMGCGPLLVKDSKLNFDFTLEEFGRKDSRVMSFFLPRLFESYEAARSFIGIRPNNKVVLGTVSGRFFGGGDNGEPCGLTFGELAQLVQDLGFKDAMGLDGGGSSSVVIRENEEYRVLNVPTGGSDVPRGSERFISTGLLIFPRS